MKYLVVIPDGMADENIPALGNVTPMAKAHKPCMDALAAQSIVGTVSNVPDGMVPESDTANMAILSFDPNYRAPLWESREQAIEEIVRHLPDATVLKVSLEEAQMITGKADVVECIEAMRVYQNTVLLVTDGPNGAYFAKDGQIGHVPGLAVKAVDTTGAGDIFFGSFLYELIKSQKAPCDLSYEDLEAFCQKAVRLSGHSVLKKGAIPSIPDYNV